jgi:hypothetical protein
MSRVKEKLTSKIKYTLAVILWKHLLDSLKPVLIKKRPFRKSYKRKAKHYTI